MKDKPQGPEMLKWIPIWAIYYKSLTWFKATLAQVVINCRSTLRTNPNVLINCPDTYWRSWLLHCQGWSSNILKHPPGELSFLGKILHIQDLHFLKITGKPLQPWSNKRQAWAMQTAMSFWFHSWEAKWETSAKGRNQCSMVLLMDEILHHLGWLKPYK